MKQGLNEGLDKVGSGRRIRGLLGGSSKDEHQTPALKSDESLSPEESNQTGERSEGKEIEVASKPVFVKVKWPFLPPLTPDLEPVHEALAERMMAYNLRIGFDLDATLKSHCSLVGVKPSEWVRNALLYVLALEQKELQSAGIVTVGEKNR